MAPSRAITRTFSVQAGSEIGRVADYHLRSIIPTDADFLFDMLVEAVNWDPERQLARSYVAVDPVLSRYLRGWPRPGDVGVIAEADDMPIGAAWLRLFTADHPGYGYVADDIPELSMAVVTAWRGRGVGRALLRETIQRARSVGYRAISLGVEGGNYARHLYVNEGFQIVDEGDDSETMLKDLTKV
jgi:GNAT superfamily N-acetyltransferase